MKKAEACARLFEIANQTREALTYSRKRIEEEKAKKEAKGEPGEPHDWELDDMAKKEKWLEALEIAGDALTN